MSWETDYAQMREVARVAGWTTPERLDAPRDGVKVPTTIDKYDAHWTFLPEQMTLERHWGDHITFIYKDGTVSHHKRQVDGCYSEEWRHNPRG